MVLKTVFLPTYTVPDPKYMTEMANLSLYCVSSETGAQPLEDESSELENEIAQILPVFDSADKDWNSFGYLLNEAASTSKDFNVSKSAPASDLETHFVTHNHPKPIGKGRRRRNSVQLLIDSKPRSEVKKEVINPADITLGGDTYDYAKQEEKPMIESIASGVARRRRTSANLSKSEDDSSNQQQTTLTTRASKERRTSEPMRAAFYGVGGGIDMDVAIPHCICQQLYDPSKFYIQCEMCARWYHGECVNVTEKKANQLEHWSCEQCVEEQERVKDEPALYCVCRKPYDDTKFYVGCDSCQGWFHPECVGITREQAEQAAEYNCPECNQGGYDSEASDGSVNSGASSFEITSRADYAHVLQLLELMIEHRMSTPFRNPVDLNEFPDYEQTIKRPMDLSTISQKVDRLEYRYLRQFVNDVNLMFENAKTYNPRDHAVFKCAETMQEVFEKKLTEVKMQMAEHQQMLQASAMRSARKRVQSESGKTVDSLDIDPEQLLPLDPSVLNYFNF
uniref:Uncharacterized protein n=1 Tax=Caenorhabditis japonica TaxID=281687 RepID=A0A8R1I4V8_CAEJA